MPLFSFRIRSPQRDRETDLARLDRLRGPLRQLRAETDAERLGLQTRCEQAQASAAFALEAFVNGDGGELSAKADELASAMRRYHARIAALEKQIAFLDSAEAEALAFYGTLADAGPANTVAGEKAASNNVAAAVHD